MNKINIKHANFDGFIDDAPCYYIHWELEGNKDYCTQVMFIEDNKPVILNHNRIFDGEKTRVNKLIKEVIEREYESLIKEAANSLKLESDYYESKAYEEVMNLPEQTQLDNWVEYYEYDNTFRAKQRLSECKKIYSIIINKYGSLQSYTELLEDKKVI